MIFRQIVHYPENQNIEEAKGKSRVVLKQQGLNIQNDAEFRPIDPQLIYKYSTNNTNAHNPVGYVEDGNRRFLSTSPSRFEYSQTSINQPLSPRMGYSEVNNFQPQYQNSERFPQSYYRPG